MNSDIKNNRNYGIDVLRMISMLMVVILHIINIGGIKNNAKGLNFHAVVILYSISFCAVNLFALISGYLGATREFKWKNIVILWLQVVFYSIGILLIYYIFQRKVITYRECFKNIFFMCFPIISNRYWYFTSYALMYCSIPVLNEVINSCDKKKLQNFIISVFVIFCIPSILMIFGKNIHMIFHHGYSPIWLAFLYLVGGYYRKYGFPASLNKQITYLCLCISVLIIYLHFSKYDHLHFLGITLSLDGESYIDPFVLLSSIMIFCIFSQYNPPCALYPILKSASPLAFSVYLIHMHPIIKEELLMGRFTFVAKMNVLFIIPIIIFIALFIYIICTFIDLIRLKVFNFILKNCFCFSRHT